MSAWKFPITLNDAGKYTVDLGDTRDVALPLQQAPEELEPELRSGCWVVLAFALWSGPDRAAIEVALAVAAVARDVRVGVRPFDDFSEFGPWCRDAPRTPRSPLWLVLRDGALEANFVGLVNAEDVLELLG